MGKQPLISLCIIVQENTGHLLRCINSAKSLADEVIIMDKASSDRISRCAEEQGAQVFTFPENYDEEWVNNFIVRQAKGEWILIADPREILLTKDPFGVRKTLMNSDNKVLMIPVSCYIDEGNISQEFACRLVRNTGLAYPILQQVLKVNPGRIMPQHSLEVLKGLQIVRYHGGDAQVLGKLCCLQGEILFEQGNYQAAYTALTEALNFIRSSQGQKVEQTTLYKVLHLRGRVYEVFMDYERALADYIEAIRVNVAGGESLTRIVAILNPKKFPEYTVDCLNKIFDLSSPKARFQLAKSLYDQSAYRMALDFLSKLCTLPEPLTGAVYLQGLALLRTRAYFPALKEFRKIDTLEPIYKNTLEQIFLCHWLQGNTIKAHSILEKMRCLGINPGRHKILRCILDGPEEFTCNPLDNKGDLNEERKSAEEILDLLLELQERGKFEAVLPTLSAVFGQDRHLILGRLYYKFGFTEQALSELEAALRLECTNSEVYYLLGLIYRNKRDYDKAGNFLNKARELDPLNPKIYLELAINCQSFCIDILGEAQAKYPGSRAIQTVIERVGETLKEFDDYR